jgi:hypothetical protein
VPIFYPVLAVVPAFTYWLFSLKNIFGPPAFVIGFIADFPIHVLIKAPKRAYFITTDVTPTPPHYSIYNTLRDKGR